MEHASIKEPPRHRQTKAFKQRLNYWQKKGMSLEEALHRAELRDTLLHSVPMEICQRRDENLPAAGRKPGGTKTWRDENLPARPKREEQETCQRQDENLPVCIEPTLDQIQREVRHLKSLGLMTELPSQQEIIADAQIFQFRKPDPFGYGQVSWSSPQKIGFESFSCGDKPDELESKTPAVSFNPSQPMLINPATHVADWSESKPVSAKNQPNTTFESIEALVSFTIVIGASSLLVHSSVEVFGFSATGWLKGLLLELGILSLSLYRSEDQLVQWGSRLGAAALIALSFMTLHAGVKRSESQKIVASMASSDILRLLHEDRARLLSAHDALPETHITRRNALIAEVQKLTGRIEAEKERSSQTLETKVIEDVHSVESLMRLALIFLNIIFSHRLRSLFKKCRVV